MSGFKTLLKTSLLGAVIVGGALAATAASADVVCNRWGECWRVHDRYDYPPQVGIVVHDDAWWAAHPRHFRWRGPDTDRGYYRNGVWIHF